MVPLRAPSAAIEASHSMFTSAVALSTCSSRMSPAAETVTKPGMESVRSIRRATSESSAVRARALVMVWAWARVGARVNRMRIANRAASPFDRIERFRDRSLLTR
jgi:hypothetical protein